MNEHDLIRLRHMLNSSREALAFMKEQNRDNLESNRMLQLAVIRLIEVIGEAARSVTQETREIYPQVDWKSMIGMRDRLIHGYYRVDLNLVWEVITQDLPPLVTSLEAIIPE